MHPLARLRRGPQQFGGRSGAAQNDHLHACALLVVSGLDADPVVPVPGPGDTGHEQRGQPIRGIAADRVHLHDARHLDPAAALESVTAAPRAVLGLPPAGIAPGCPADLVAIPGGDALEALGAASAHRTVWRAGRVVARTTVHAEISSPRRAEPSQLEGAAT